MATAKLGLDDMTVSQSGKYITYNEAVKIFDALMGGAKSQTTSAEPGSPADGDVYILPASPTGTNWASFSQNDVVVYRGSEWVQLSPFEGFGVFWVHDDDELVTYDGTNWVAVSSGNGVADLTSAEVTQLANIDSTTISAAQWGYVGGADQNVRTTDNVQFNELDTLARTDLGTGVAVGGNTILTAGGLTVQSANTSYFGTSHSMQPVIIVGSSTYNACLHFRNGTSGNDWFLFQDSADSDKLKLQNETTSILDITKAGAVTLQQGLAVGGGTDFMDTYEEGTWTPAITFATAGDLSVAYTTQKGQYIRIGKTVWVGFDVLTSSFTHTTAASFFRLSGLPFTCANISSFRPQSTLEFEGITKASYTQFSAEVAANTTYFNFTASGSAQTLSNLTVSDVPTGGTVRLRGMMVYIVD